MERPSNLIGGTSKTLLLGTYANGPGDGQYFHPFNIVYSRAGDDANRTQLAIPYKCSHSNIWMRSRYGMVWTGWQEIERAATRKVSTKKDLVKVLGALRKATMDETQDIRESLRSAIDEFGSRL